MHINELTLLYTIIDDFFQSFFETILWQNIKCFWLNKRGPKKQLSLSEVVTLNMMRFYMRIEDLKTFHKIAVNQYKNYFPNIPNYENFLKATNKSAIFMLLVIRFLLDNNIIECNNSFFIDSTDLPVCKNYNIYKHKVAKYFAKRGKTSKGWFYGFKLHAVCDKSGNLVNIFFTAGNVHDNKALDKLILNFKGIFTCDSGYLQKEKDLRNFFDNEQILYIATRKNMKRLMTKEQKALFKERSIIETVWDVLKERFKIIYSLARSIHGLFRHYFYSIGSFLLKEKLKNNSYYKLNLESGLLIN